MREQVYFYFLEAKFSNVFNMSWLAVNIEICSVKFTLEIEFYDGNP